MSTPLKTVNATDANQQFSKLLREVEEHGTSFRIIRRDAPVAILTPDSDNERLAKCRAELLREMRRLLKKGLSLGKEPFDRDALHDRD